MPGVIQTQEHLFKACTAWRKQQNVLWKEVRSQTKRGWDRFRIADLYADERGGGAILEFLETTDVGWKIREVWEEGSDGSVEGGDEVEVEEGLAVVEVYGGGIS